MKPGLTGCLLTGALLSAACLPAHAAQIGVGYSLARGDDTVSGDAVPGRLGTDSRLQEVTLALSLGEWDGGTLGRINVGYMTGHIDYDDGERDKLDGIDFDGSLGYQLFQVSNFQVWAGGHAKVVVLRDGGDNNGSMWGAGPIAGVNYDIGDYRSVTMEVGYRFLGIDADTGYAQNGMNMEDVFVRFSMLWGI